MDETGYKDVQAKYLKNGQWNKEGVKNHLALPCFNKANALDVAEVTKPTTAVESTVGKATEVIKYNGKDGYTTGQPDNRTNGQNNGRWRKASDGVT